MDKRKGRTNWPDEKLLARALSAKTDKAYRNNTAELKSRASANLYARCLELARSELPAERAAGVDILSELYRNNQRTKYGTEFPYRKEALALFLAMLATEKDSTVTIALLYGIGKNNRTIKPKDIDRILAFAAAEDANIRFAAVCALSCIESMKAIRGLIRLATDKYSSIRNWATFAIGTQSELDNEAIRKALYARCTDKHYDTRLEAIYGLAKRKDAGVKPYLEKEFADCTVYVLESIQCLNATEYLPRLEAMLAEYSDKPETYGYWLGHLQECIATLRQCPQLD